MQYTTWESLVGTAQSRLDLVNGRRPFEPCPGCERLFLDRAGLKRHLGKSHTNGFK